MEQHFIETIDDGVATLKHITGQILAIDDGITAMLASG